MVEIDKKGSFYLGHEFDWRKQQLEADPEKIIHYDAGDLTTHAVCVGMTGSGKTGLCLALLEEAALNGVPAIAIDPKGDLGNLLLAFPKLRPGGFSPLDRRERCPKEKRFARRARIANRRTVAQRAGQME